MVRMLVAASLMEGDLCVGFCNAFFCLSFVHRSVHARARNEWPRVGKVCLSSVCALSSLESSHVGSDVVGVTACVVLPWQCPHLPLHNFKVSLGKVGFFGVYSLLVGVGFCIR